MEMHRFELPGLLSDAEDFTAIASRLAERIPMFGGLLSEMINAPVLHAADFDREAAYAAQDRVNAGMGINVRTDKKAGLRYADLIVDGQKQFETRNSDSLRPYVGKRVAIVRTGEGPAEAIGEVKIGEPIKVDEKTFRAYNQQHLVPEGSDFDIKPDGSKYLYPVESPQRYKTPRKVGKGIISRKVFD